MWQWLTATALALGGPISPERVDYQTLWAQVIDVGANEAFLHLPARADGECAVGPMPLFVLISPIEYRGDHDWHHPIPLRILFPRNDIFLTIGSACENDVLAGHDNRRRRNSGRLPFCPPRPLNVRPALGLKIQPTLQLEVSSNGFPVIVTDNVIVEAIARRAEPDSFRDNFNGHPWARMSQAVFPGTSPIPRIEGGSGSGEQREKSADSAVNPHPRHLIGEPRLRLGRIRRTRLLDEIIALECVIFSLFGAAFTLTRGLPAVPNGRENRWLAATSACLVVWIAAFCVLVTRQVWLPWS